MATNILASRLAHLEHQGLLVKKFSQQDKRKEEYVLTEKGLDLIPVLVEMANWSAEHDPHTAAPAAWIALMKAEREKMIQLIRETEPPLCTVSRMSWIIFSLSAFIKAIQAAGAAVCGSCSALQLAISTRTGMRSRPFSVRIYSSFRLSFSESFFTRRPWCSR